MRVSDHLRIHSRSTRLIVGLAAAAFTTGLVEPGIVSPGLRNAAVTIGTHQLTPSFARLPLRFEPNVGQAVPDVQYLARGDGYGVDLTARRVEVTLRGKPTRARHAALNSDKQVADDVCVSLSLSSANSHALVRAEQLQGSHSNYFIGNDRSRWRSNVPNYGGVRYVAVYPGVDWVIYGNPQQLEYDFIVAPYANPGAIELAVAGAEQMVIDDRGDLLVTVRGRTVRQLKPVVYQTSAFGERVRVAGEYVLHHDRVTFALGTYDPSRTLIIDPALAYSTYLGGTLGETAYAIAVDSAGSAYVAGQTSSSDFPTVGALQTQNKTDNAFVAKFSPSGTELIYATYFGGSVGEIARAVTVDDLGNAYVAGTTFSHDFPTLNAVQDTFKGAGAGATQGFVTKLNASGSALEYSTYLGGSGGLDAVYAVALDDAGALYVTGETDSSDFPVVEALQASLHGRINSFVSKFSAAGNTLDYSTYLGGSAADFGQGVAIDGAGNAYIVGYTNSTDFPTANPLQASNHVSVNGSTNTTAFVAKLNPQGRALIYSTYLGGSGSDQALAVALDTLADVYIAGSTGSADFPTVNAFQSINKAAQSNGGPTAFITKINSAGNALVYSTYLGGSGGGQGVEGDYGRGIAINASGEVFVTGLTTSTDFPTASPVQNTNQAAALQTSNAFVAQLSSDGASLLFSTYLGGSGSYGPSATHTSVPLGDSANGIALDSAGGIYIAGAAGSANFPTLNAYQAMNNTATSYGSATTAFVTKFGIESTTPTPTADPSPTSSGKGGGGMFGWELLLLLSARLTVSMRGHIFAGGSGSSIQRVGCRGFP